MVADSSAQQTAQIQWYVPRTRDKYSKTPTRSWRREQRLATDLLSLTLEQGAHVKTEKTERRHVGVGRRIVVGVLLVGLPVPMAPYCIASRGGQVSPS